MYELYKYALSFLLESSDSSDDGSTGAIVGAVVGGIVGIILILLLLMILWCYCKKYKNERKPTGIY